MKGYATSAPEALPSGAISVDDALSAYDTKPRAAGGRAGYKSGGAVPHKHIEHLVNSLMHKARKARKQATDHTAVLLKHDDSTIVSALNAAKRAI